ncbi:snoal-like polyketide cyclase family [Pyrenophora seminiperda CCB06]|uniref:Snoal-like polyketide cyclase family n=1 Tax=Pyrenophora seminiperda CCB06 TaxID=1302712 RepID=A0A3M7MDF9_9PLEO|nr:snoal-like polyketide cyclase family [Pyrenophora seminiperda CCB06]
MRASILLSASMAPLAILAMPANVHGISAFAKRQASPIKPAPCVSEMNTTAEETEFLAAGFADAFVYDLNITEAFTYIAADYINHNPSVKNGSDAAWSALSPFWDQQNITVTRTGFKSPQSWLEYSGKFGAVVDRFRWEGGCIVEHVSAIHEDS